MTDLRDTLNFHRFDASFGAGTPATSTVSTDRSKRVSDIVIAALLLVFTLPLLLLVWGWIRFNSRGPAFTVQRRAGLSGRIIDVYNFRTRNSSARCADGAPEVSTTGKLLRRAGIDKLPQLLNVLMGDMSMVGPMPHSPSVDEYYRPIIPQYSGRTRAKPGFTGLAQVNGLDKKKCSVQGMAERISDDNAYIDYWSTSLDFKILGRAAISTFYRTRDL